MEGAPGAREEEEIKRRRWWRRHIVEQVEGVGGLGAVSLARVGRRAGRPIVALLTEVEAAHGRGGEGDAVGGRLALKRACSRRRS